tara:strand:- start:502 stop:867 length:366 start_codon:yes stop_codon:yes gene_type:complete
MNKFLSALTYLFGLLFLFNAVRWLLLPTEVAGELGMPLLEGEGLSTQIGDFASFFFIVGGFIVLGAYTKNKHWFYAPIALLSVAAFSRTIAYLFHNAAFSVDKIVVELVVAFFLLFVANRK